MRKRWMLRSVRGEPAAAASPRPSPAHSPEAVLEAQLSALADQRYTDVFAHASPANRRATGPVQKFARMLNAPAFAGLLGHEAAETLQRRAGREENTQRRRAGREPRGLWNQSRQAGRSR